jgi:fructose-bisphosphate aldolase class II
MENLEYYFKKAKAEKFAIPQFNFSDFTQVKGIIAKCAELKSPVILGTSEGESQFFGLEEAVALRNVLRKKLGLPIFLNLDHGKSLDYVKQAIDAGYDSVHFDGSKIELQENIKIAKEVVKYAKKKSGLFGNKILVEGEVGKIGTDSSKIYSEKFVIKEEDLTKPDEAEKFIKETGVDLLAVSIGNLHGIEISGINPNLKIDLLKKVAEKIKNTFLVLHGGSGVPEEDIKEAIKNGIVKININTELRMAFAGNLRRALSEVPEEIVPYKFLVKAQRSVEKVVELKLRLFDNINKI